MTIPSTLFKKGKSLLAKHVFFLPMLFLLFVTTLSISIFFYIDSNVSTLRGSVIEYLSYSRAEERKSNRRGRIIVLPGESYRFNPQDGLLYIRNGEGIFSIQENYLSRPAKTNYEFYPKGWLKLVDDEYLVFPEKRSFINPGDYITEDNVVKQSQIATTHQVGRKSDLTLRVADEFKNFSIKIDPSWLVWQRKLDTVIDINSPPVIQDDVVFVSTLDGVTTAFDARSGDTLKNEEVVKPTQSLSHVQTEEQKAQKQFETELLNNRVVLRKKDEQGKILWQHTSYDLEYFPLYFELQGRYLVGIGRYIAYREDPSYGEITPGERVYVFDAESGKSLYVKDDITFDLDRVLDDGFLLINDSIRYFDTATGELVWTYSAELDSDFRFWFSEDKQTLYLVNGRRFSALNLADEVVLWEREMEVETHYFMAKNGVIYLWSIDSLHYFALNAETGEILWQVAIPDGWNQLRIAGQNQVFFESFNKGKVAFSLFDQETKKLLKIFDYSMPYVSDNENIIFRYENNQIYVFVDDFVAALKYQPD